MMPSLSLLIKPSSGNCNVRCKYCFYHDEQENRDTFSYGFMSEETLEVLVKKALQYADRECSFGFQGGEPTLRGLDFSPIRGPEGNIEYLAWLEKDGSDPVSPDIPALVEASHRFHEKEES